MCETEIGLNVHKLGPSISSLVLIVGFKIYLPLRRSDFYKFSAVSFVQNVFKLFIPMKLKKETI